MSLNNLLENLIKNNQSAGFDFSKSAGSNQFPYPYDEKIDHFDTGEEVPLSPKASRWKSIKANTVTYLSCDFKFQSLKHLLYFLNKVIVESDEANHHPEIIINNLDVEINVFTHDLRDVSHLDLKIAKNIDEIYEDIQYLRSL
tara:strand:+ start:2231 stop:2659 length:429 start_codon:yes stop_codon:yes gene_type:complete